MITAAKVQLIITDFIGVNPYILTILSRIFYISRIRFCVNGEVEIVVECIYQCFLLVGLSSFLQEKYA